jgi:hypothetical protein
MPHCGSLLGFSHLVAPNSKTARDAKPLHHRPPVSGDVSQLLGGSHATPKVAPPLHLVIRECLQRRQVSPQGIDAYLSKYKSFSRYDNAFNAFWYHCGLHHVTLLSASLEVIASELLLLHQISPPTARHAYSALLLIPGMDQLRFSPLLSRVKREWNHSEARYASFWDASLFLQTLSTQVLDWSTEKAVRDRLIICWRLLGLHRSIDLARLQRSVSFVDSTPFVLVQRKGWQTPKWEQVMVLPATPSICPFRLLEAYVALTAKKASPGSLVLRSLRPPFSPLTADRVSSLTRMVLSQGGVNTQAWAPHSTRGAGVRMFKGMVLSSEEVCEIGQWKNVGAFTAHYLRLDAQKSGGKTGGLLSAQCLTW